MISFRHRSKRILSASAPRIVNPSKDKKRKNTYLSPDKSKNTCPEEKSSGDTSEISSTRTRVHSERSVVTPFRPRVFTEFSPSSPLTQILITPLSNCYRCSAQIGDISASTALHCRIFHNSCYYCKQCQASLLEKQAIFHTDDELYCKECVSL